MFGSFVAVVRPLVVARGREQQSVGPVADSEQRHLRAFEELLDEHRAAEAARRLEAGAKLLVGPTDHDALSLREAVGLQDAGGARRVEQRGGRDAGRLHHLLREPLRALDACSGGRRAEDRDTGVAKCIGDAGDERRLGPDDHELGIERPCEPEQPVAVVVRDGMAGGERRDARVAGGGVQLRQRGGRREPPRERMLATARADEENAHRPSLGLQRQDGVAGSSGPRRSSRAR